VNFKLHYLEKILNYIFENKSKYISVKGIRKHFQKKGKEKSFINFMWRILKSLEKNGFLDINQNHSKPKVYTLSYEFKLLISLYKSKEERNQLLEDIFNKIK
jgi:hypothetical protein